MDIEYRFPDIVLVVRKGDRYQSAMLMGGMLWSVEKLEQVMPLYLKKLGVE